MGSGKNSYYGDNSAYRPTKDVKIDKVQIELLTAELHRLEQELEEIPTHQLARWERQQRKINELNIKIRQLENPIHRAGECFINKHF